MKTNYIPAIVMLAAGFIDCLFGIANGLNAKTFVTELFIVLVVFYIIGIVMKCVLDRNFKMMKKDQEEDSEESEKESEPEEETEPKEDNV